jgi:DNA polymerase-3 subunit delta'
MNLIELETTQPIAARFFRQALESHTLAHAYVLKGRQTDVLYNTALEIAKILNCSEPLTAVEPCGQCVNCHWIRDNSHPAVLTLSRLTFMVNEKGELMDETKLVAYVKKHAHPTMIKTDQIQRLIEVLHVSSPHCRVVIFTDVEERPALADGETAEDGAVVPPADWRVIPENAGKRFCVRPMTRDLFNASSANRFLKTLEEPPPNIVFFYLTDSEENLLETIVSRCQVVPFLSKPKPPGAGLSDSQRAVYRELAQRLPHSADFYPLAGVFHRDLVDGEGLTLEQALEGFQIYLWEAFHQETLSPEQFQRFRRWQQWIEQAKSRLERKTNTEQTLNALLSTLSAPSRLAWGEPPPS